MNETGSWLLLKTSNQPPATRNQIMLKNYLKIAVRNLLNHKSYSFINITGLAMGMASCLMILLYVLDELSFDAYHEKAGRIYRVIIERFEEDGLNSRLWGPISPGYGPKLLSEFPQIQHATRFWMWTSPVLSHGDKKFVEEAFVFTEPAVFDIFTFPFIEGDSATALTEPNTIVLTENAAQKYFGRESPLGKTLAYQSGSTKEIFQITGVIKNVPKNSHFTFDFAAAFATWENIAGKEFMGFLGGDYNYPTYILLSENVQATDLAALFPAFIDRNMEEIHGRQPYAFHKIHLQPLRDVYLRSPVDGGYGPTGDIATVHIFAAVAFLILLIACINFINLATARSARRAREVGMRKVLGAFRCQLIKQFLGESFLLTTLALLLAVVVVESLLPAFNTFSGKVLALNYASDAGILFGLIAIALFVGIFAGSYPAIFLSRIQPARVLKGTQPAAADGSLFRSGLVVFQLAISIALIISVGMVKKQLDFLRNKKLGFNKEQIVSLPASREMIQKLEFLKHQLKQHPGIVNITASSRVPSGILNDALDARTFKEGEAVPVGFRLPFVRVDHDFFETFGMEIIAGRDFLRELSTDSSGAYIINETAATQLGWHNPEDAVGQELGYGQFDGRVIGVVKDFHFESLHLEIKPMLFHISQYLHRISVRIRTDDIPGTLAFLQEEWQRHRPDYPFSYYFIDERFNQRYENEEKLGKLFGVFSLLAIFIACLGLFRLAAFTAEQRTKEIGIRKVLGASIGGILALLSKNFVKLVVIANLIAWPVAWYAMNHWLQNFAYRVEIGWRMFALASCLALVIALVTVSMQAIKAALANPVESLRYE
jgi:putative ABC transport system permease protein